MTKERKLPIMEIFGPTIQGEGLMSGTVTNFLRTGGCGLNCQWCDTMYAVDPKQVRAGRTLMTTSEIISTIQSMPYAPYLTLTGGDPCMHKTLGEIITPLNMHGVHIAVETQGQFFPDWLKDVDVVTFSPKPPSSGNIVDFRGIYDWIMDNFGELHRPNRICIKIVCFDHEDLKYAMDCYDYMPPLLYDAFYVSAGTPGYDNTQEPQEEEEELTPEVREARALHKLMGVVGSQRHLADQIVKLSQVKQFNHKFHIGCQQHVMLWPEIERGV